MRRLLALTAIAACSSGRKPEPVRALDGDLVIANVTVVPMDRDGSVVGQSVIIRGDRIVAVVPMDRVTMAAGATRVDGTGKWLMPGLADMHVHTWSEQDLTMFVVAGVTTVRNMFGSEQHLAWRKEIAAGKRFGPTLVTASPIVDGDPPVWPGSAVVTKPDDADGVVAGFKAQGYDFVKPYSRLQAPVYDALVAAAAKYGLSLQGHVPTLVGLEHALASKQRSIEHLDGWFRALAGDVDQSGGNYWKTMARMVAKADESRIPALAQAMTKAGTWNCPTLIVTSRMAALDDVAAIEKQVKWLAYVPSEVRAMWDPKADFRMSSADAEDYAAMRAANLIRDKIVRGLATASAPLLVGTDTGNPFVVPGEAMHDEIELLVKAGTPRARVLRAATADAATFLGLQGTLGVVAPGARADLLLVGVDPLTSPLPLIPDGVVVRGTWLPRSALEAKLAALATPRAPADRFKDMPPLAPEGTDVQRAHYEIRAGDKVIGEERLTTGLVGATRVVIAQAVADVPGHTEIDYRIAGTSTRIEVKSGFGTLAIAAKPQGGKLVASGKDVAGNAITLAEPLATDTFLAAPGIGGTVELAGKLAGMKVGQTRKARSLELAYFPRPHIEAASYEIARKPDTDGNRAFAITYRFANMTVASELVLDAKGLPVRQTFGPPIGFTFVRRD